MKQATASREKLEGALSSSSTRTRAAVAVTLSILGGPVGCHLPLLSEPAQVLVPAAEDDGAARPFVLPPALATDPREDAIVRVVGAVSCSGVLVDDDLVLTAHHCVSRRDAAGRALRADLSPDEVTIELGGDDLPWGEVGVRAIVAPNCGYVAGRGDIAVLVLSRKLVGMPIVDVRLHEPPAIGERIAPWGFGRCAASGTAIRRVSREGQTVSAVTADEVVADAAICPGDSGGPVFGEGRDVIGVVSASVMDADPATVAPSLFTRVDTWTGIFSAARAIGDGASPAELPPYRSCRPL